MDTIKKAVNQGHKALSEFQSKHLLASYGIPITRETLAESMDNAVSYAEDIGYPVVLKACSHELMHKSEKDCIRLSLKNKEEVMEAYDHVMNSVGMAVALRISDGALSDLDPDDSSRAVRQEDRNRLQFLDNLSGELAIYCIDPTCDSVAGRIVRTTRGEQWGREKAQRADAGIG